MQVRLVVASMLAVSAVFPAAAQNADAEAFRLYVTSEDYKMKVGQAAMASEKYLEAGCAEARPTERADLTVFEAPVFEAGQPHPAAGVWRDRLKVDRCGKIAFHNILILAQKGQAPQFGWLLPGDTAAMPPLQAETIKMVAKRGENVAKNCTDSKTFRVLDTRREAVVTEPKRDEKTGIVAGKWREIWTAKLCNKPYDVAVEFGTDGSGRMTVETQPAAAVKDTAKKKDKKK